MKVFCLYSIVLLSLLFKTSFAQQGVLTDTIIACRNYLIAKHKIDESDFKNSNTYLKKAAALYMQQNCINRWIDCQYLIADNHLNMAELSNARKTVTEALTFLEKIRSIGYAAKLEKILGVIELREGNYQLARNCFLKALNMVRKNPRAYDSALLINDLGTVYAYENRRESALQYFELADKLLPVGFPKKPLVKSNVGSMYTRMENHHRALEVQKEALAITNEKTVTGSKILATVYLNIGACYGNLMDYDIAIAYLKKAISIYENTGDLFSLNLAHAYSNIGALYNDKNDFDEGQKFLSKAEAIINKINPNHPLASVIYNNFAYRYYVENNYTEAANFYNRSLQISMLNDDDAKIAHSLNYLAQLMLKQKKYEEALEITNKILALKFKENGQEALAREYRAKVFVERGDYKQSLIEINIAITLLTNSFRPKRIEDNPTFSSFYINPTMIELLAIKASYLAKFAKQHNNKAQLQAALATYHLAVNLMDNLQSKLHTDDAKLSATNEFTNMYENAIALCSYLYKETNHTHYLEEAFYFSEKNRTALIRQQLNHQLALTYLGVSDSLVKKEYDLKSLLGYYQKELAEPESLSEEDKKYFTDRAFKLNNEYEALMATLAKSYPQFYKLKFANSVATTKEIQQNLLRKNEAILRFFAGDSALYTFLITKASIKIYSHNNPSGIDFTASKMLDGLRNKQYEKYSESAFQLYKILIKPLALPTDIDILIIIPDGKLNYIPFEALLSERPSDKVTNFKNLSYLLRQYLIRYNISASVMLENQQLRHENTSKSFIAFAPVFSDTSFKVSTLLNSEREVRNAAQWMKGDYLLKAQATEQAFKQHASDYSVFHFASHAIVNDQKPMYSKLLFYPQHDSTQDGVLYSYELYNMKLPAQLVSLSACNTGTGKLERGEGLISMARAFMFAGSQSMLVSLWPVSDNPSQKLMDYFYEALADGKDKDEALQEAKLKYLDQADELSADPFLWSGFVLIGSEQGISAKNSMLWKGVFLFGMILILSALLYYRKIKGR